LGLFEGLERAPGSCRSNFRCSICKSLPRRGQTFCVRRPHCLIAATLVFGDSGYLQHLHPRAIASDLVPEHPICGYEIAAELLREDDKYGVVHRHFMPDCESQRLRQELGPVRNEKGKGHQLRPYPSRLLLPEALGPFRPDDVGELVEKGGRDLYAGAPLQELRQVSLGSVGSFLVEEPLHDDAGIQHPGYHPRSRSFRMISALSGIGPNESRSCRSRSRTSAGSREPLSSRSRGARAISDM